MLDDMYMNLKLVVLVGALSLPISGCLTAAQQKTLDDAFATAVAAACPAEGLISPVLVALCPLEEALIDAAFNAAVAAIAARSNKTPAQVKAELAATKPTALVKLRAVRTHAGVTRLVEIASADSRVAADMQAHIDMHDAPTANAIRAMKAR